MDKLTQEEREALVDTLVDAASEHAIWQSTDCGSIQFRESEAALAVARCELTATLRRLASTPVVWPMDWTLVGHEISPNYVPEPVRHPNDEPPEAILLRYHWRRVVGTWTEARADVEPPRPDKDKKFTRAQVLEDGIRGMMRWAKERDDEYTYYYLEGCLESADLLAPPKEVL